MAREGKEEEREGGIGDVQLENKEEEEAGKRGKRKKEGKEWGVRRRKSGCVKKERRRRKC